MPARREVRRDVGHKLSADSDYAAALLRGLQNYYGGDGIERLGG